MVSHALGFINVSQELIASVKKKKNTTLLLGSK